MKIEGIFPALPTPFKSDGELDEIGLARLVDHVIAGGVHGLWALGSTGEFPSLNRNKGTGSSRSAFRRQKGEFPSSSGWEILMRE